MYGPPELEKLFLGIRHRFGRKFLPFSVYSFTSCKKILGIKRPETIEKFATSNVFLQSIYSDINPYLENQYFDSYEKEINDASLFINSKGNYQDEDVEIIPVVMNPKPTISYICIFPKTKAKIS